MKKIVAIIITLMLLIGFGKATKEEKAYSEKRTPEYDPALVNPYVVDVVEYNATHNKDFLVVGEDGNWTWYDTNMYNFATPITGVEDA